MQIAVTSTGPSLNDSVEARFGRCPYFVLVDTETLEFDSIPNPNMTLGGGAGIQFLSRASQTNVPKESELNLLKETASDIRRQLAEIESKIEAISKKE